MARTTSEYTKGTQAMKMNITFCDSSMPNHRMVSGISAATGRFRPKSAIGAPAASIARHDAGHDAERHANEDGETEPDQHALAMLRRCFAAVPDR